MNQDSTIRDLDFYRQLWVRLVGGEFSASSLAERVRNDGGMDIGNLSDAELLDLIEGRFSGNWTEAAFSSSELLAYYAVPGAITGPEQIVGWVFIAFVAADAIKEDALEWEAQFNSFMNGFLSVRDQLEREECVQIFHRVFCGGFLEL
jgi:hypothetical protein